MVPFPWIIAGAAIGLLAGPRMRASVFLRSTRAGEPPRRACPACSHQVLPGRWRWCPVLPVTGRCPACQTRIGPYPLLAEFAAGLALAVVAARATSAWELAGLACLVLAAVPLAFIDVALHRLPDPLTAAAFAGTLVLLSAAALAGHQPDRLARAAIGAAALACFYLALCLLRPGQMGLGDLLTELRRRSPQAAERNGAWLFPQLEGRERCLGVPQSWSWMCSPMTVRSASVGGHRWGNRGCGMPGG
jgi:leader peptidase (prepilin peptidase) / N-methyltransferase